MALNSNYDETSTGLSRNRSILLCWLKVLFIFKQGRADVTQCYLTYLLMLVPILTLLINITECSTLA